MQSQRYITLLLTLAVVTVLHAQSSDNSSKGNSGANSKSGNAAAPTAPSGSANRAGPQAGGAPRPSAAFELPRLRARGNRDDSSAMAKSKATIDDLSSNGRTNVRAGTSEKIKTLTIDSGTSWSRPLRGGPRDTVFVSFFVYGSDGTVIDAAGVRLQIRAAATRPGYAQLYVGTSTKKGVNWRKFGGLVKLEPHGGNSLAALPVLTVRIDRAAKMWDLYISNRLALTDQPLADLPKGAPNQFTLRAGSAGALICGLISAEENPLYEDENANGIDDAFEKGRNGGALLAAKAPPSERGPLARQWQQEQQQRQIKPWPVQRPLPDKASQQKS